MQSARIQMIESKGIEFLINVLQKAELVVKDTERKKNNEKSASKAAVALGALCKDYTTADQIIKLGGLVKLVNLVTLADQNDNYLHAAVIRAVKIITNYIDMKDYVGEEQSYLLADVSESFV